MNKIHIKISIIALTSLVILSLIYLFVVRRGPNKIIVGHPACLSGKFSKPGGDALGAIKACIKWVNEVHGGVKIGKKKIPIVLKTYDTQSQKGLVTKYLEELITVDKADFILAPYSSGLTLHGAPVPEKYGVLYMDHAGASDRIFDQGFEYIVQPISPATLYHIGIFDMIQTIDPGARVALLYEDAPFAAYVMTGAERRAKKLGFNIVFRDIYPKGVTDLTSQLTELKASRPDIVIGGGHYKDGVLFARQMAALDINTKVLSLLASVNMPAFYKALGNSAEGMMGPSQWEYGVKYSPGVANELGLDWFGPFQEEFVRLFKDAVGKDIKPSYQAANAGSGLLSLVKGIEMANSLDSVKVRDALGRLNFMSFYGLFDIDDTGKQIAHSMVHMQWQDGKSIIVWPPDAATGKLRYP